MNQKTGRHCNVRRQLPFTFVAGSGFSLAIRLDRINIRFDCSQSGEMAGPAVKAGWPQFPCAWENEGSTEANRPVIQCRKGSPVLSGLGAVSTRLLSGGPE